MDVLCTVVIYRDGQPLRGEYGHLSPLDSKIFRLDAWTLLSNLSDVSVSDIRLHERELCAVSCEQLRRSQVLLK